MAKQRVDSLPHSWDIEHWPANIFPHESGRARQFVRRHQNELLACGALTRIGRFKVLLGAGYAAFLAKNISRVEGFEVAAFKRNASEIAA